MSINEQNPGDRRVVRTRQAIIEAVTRLIFSKGVASVSMASVADAANVGRSTWYEHFKNKDELLAASIAPLFDALADGCVVLGDDPDILSLVAHFWGGRAFAPSMLQGRAGQVIGRVMIDSFERALVLQVSTSDKQISVIHTRSAAIYMARGTIGILLDWLTGKVAGSPTEIAAMLRAFGHANWQFVKGD
jgi:AcrR family transcriptional regulator